LQSVVLSINHASWNSGAQVEEALVFCLRAKTHDVFDAGSIIQLRPKIIISLPVGNRKLGGRLGPTREGEANAETERRLAMT
jgi:hypothetical protein